MFSPCPCSQHLYCVCAERPLAWSKLDFRDLGLGARLLVHASHLSALKMGRCGEKHPILPGVVVYDGVSYVGVGVFPCNLNRSGSRVFFIAFLGILVHIAESISFNVAVDNGRLVG